jgi:hypothetical protein
VLRRRLERSGVTQTEWLLPELWRLVAEYAARLPGTCARSFTIRRVVKYDIELRVMGVLGVIV